MKGGRGRGREKGSRRRMGGGWRRMGWRGNREEEMGEGEVGRRGGGKEGGLCVS